MGRGIFDTVYMGSPLNIMCKKLVYESIRNDVQ